MEQKRKIGVCRWSGANSNLKQGALADFTDKGTFVQRLEEDKKVSHVDFQEKHFSYCHGPKHEMIRKIKLSKGENGE